MLVRKKTQYYKLNRKKEVSKTETLVLSFWKEKDRKRKMNRQIRRLSFSFGYQDNLSVPRFPKSPIKKQ